MQEVCLRFLSVGLTLALVALVVPACGAGGTAGPGPAGAGQGLILVNLNVSGVDNVPINEVVRFDFSEAVDPQAIIAQDEAQPGIETKGPGNGSIQIRQGSAFGLTAAGAFEVSGATVFFYPELPAAALLPGGTSTCTLTGGFEPGTVYRVTLLGSPEALAVRNTQGQPLDETVTREFTTSASSDGMLRDQMPGEAPTVLSFAPVDSAAAVAVVQGNEIVVELSENVDPCSISYTSVVLRSYEVGDKDTFEPTPTDTESGFIAVQDSTPNDPYTWGATEKGSEPVTPPQTIPAALILEQTFQETILRVVPTAGVFPENTLVVLDLTFGILDFGGFPLVPATVAFTTENIDPQPGTLRIEFDVTTPVDVDNTTADVDTLRSPGRAQGWLAFAGDGDNGGDEMTPGFPFPLPVCDWRMNAGSADHFNPTVDTVLNTGARTTCVNPSDGSTAVIWEFASFTIDSGRTVTILGENPALILVTGAVNIHGTLRLSGGTGGTGVASCQPGGNPGTPGPGGGAGGEGGYQSGATSPYGEDGESGYGSAAPYVRPGIGGGEGGVAYLEPGWWGGCGVGGGGGGHAFEGGDGASQISGTTATTQWAATPVRGNGGGTYPATDTELFSPATGSGGGGGGGYGGSNASSWNPSGCASGTSGGGGGGGGGFVGITAGGKITVAGLIDARGGRGGTGGSGSYSGGAGGGGGSGGAVRLLTSSSIDLNSAMITTAGGIGGTGLTGGYTGTSSAPHIPNAGGAGGWGRIVLETPNASIDNIAGAVLLPGDGQEGFVVDALDTSRFVSGADSTTAVTGLIFVGPLTPPVFEEAKAEDFIAGTPNPGSRPGGNTAILVEVQGFPLDADGTPDLTTPTGWWTIGHFMNSGAETEPIWFPDSNPPDVTPPSDNAGAGHIPLNGSGFVQVRLTFYMGPDAAVDSPGPYVDRMDLNYLFDQ